MNTIDQNVVTALKSISVKQLKFVDRVIHRVLSKKISINQAILVEQYAVGDKVNYLTNSGEIRQAVVNKVNQVRINIFDKKAKKFVDVYPDSISPPKVSQMVTNKSALKLVEPTDKRKAGRPRKAGLATN